jgi:ABC-type transport system substrate-binding protein
MYTTTRGPAYDLMSELIQQYCQAIGVRLEYTETPYAVFQPNISVKGEFDGLAHNVKGTGIRGQFEGYYLPGGTRNNAHVDDPVLNDKIKAMLRTNDQESFRRQVLDLQNYTDEKMYYVPTQIGAAGDYVGFGGDTRNAAEYRVVGFDQPNETLPYFWKQRS